MFLFINRIFLSDLNKYLTFFRNIENMGKMEKKYKLHNEQTKSIVDVIIIGFNLSCHYHRIIIFYYIIIITKSHHKSFRFIKTLSQENYNRVAKLPEKIQLARSFNPH